VLRARFDGEGDGASEFLGEIVSGVVDPSVDATFILEGFWVWEMDGEVVADAVVRERGAVCGGDLSAWPWDIEVQGSGDFLCLRGGGCGGFLGGRWRFLRIGMRD
jgi:hypothetical protein